MFFDFKRIHLVVTWLSYFITLLLGIQYLFNQQLETLLFVLMGLFISNLLFCLNHLKYYLIQFFFYLTMFVFLFSRPFIDYLRNGSFVTYQSDAYRFAFTALILSMTCLLIGGIFARILFTKKKKENLQRVLPKIDAETYQRFLEKLRLVSVWVFFLTYPFYVLRLLERLMYRRNTSYYEYYASFQSQLPYFTYILSTFMFYSLCVYLATKPKKLHATFFLVLYVLANSIHLVIGTRNPVILSLLFAFMYYCMRSFDPDDKEEWIGRRERFAIIVGTPTLMLLMGALNYIRDGAEVKFNSIFALLADFIYKQGTSFGVLARGYIYKSSLPIREFRNYTFGPIIDYFYRGNIGIHLFGAKPFTTSTNSIELALNSNSYAHSISYLAIDEAYLEGHGIGGSYIMDIFTDYSYIGLIIFNMVLGFILVAMMQSAYQKKVLPFVISLVVLGEIFFTARSSFASSFFYLFTMQFWVIIILIFFASKLIVKKIQYKTKGEV